MGQNCSGPQGPPRLIQQHTHTWVSHDNFADVGMSAYAEGQEFDEDEDIEVFQDCALMVSDLSGFTKLIKNHGEIYLASVIIRCRQLALPTINNLDPLSVSYEADNLIVVFEDILEALEATLTIQHIIMEYRASFPEGKKDSAPKLGGLGLHSGICSKHRMRHKLYGNTFMEGYHLGEEVADKSLEISQSVYDNIPEEVQRFFTLNEDGMEEHKEEVPFNIYTRSFKQSPIDVLRAIADYKGHPFSIPASRFADKPNDPPGVGPLFAPADDDRFLHPNLIPFCKLHLPEIVSDQTRFNKAKASLKRKWTSTGVALVYEVLFSRDAPATKQIKLEVKLQHVVNNSAVKYGGYAANEKVVLFANASDAVKGTVAFRQALQAYNEDVKENAPEDYFECRGYGLHTSTIVNVKQTDIQFGYAINVASKMGEDCAKGGVILLSPEVYAMIETDECFKGVTWRREKMTASGATYEPYVLQEPDGGLDLEPPEQSTAQLIADVEHNRRQCNKLQAELEQLKRDIPLIVARALTFAVNEKVDAYSKSGGLAGEASSGAPAAMRQHTFNATTNRASKGRNKIVLSQPTEGPSDVEGNPQIL